MPEIQVKRGAGLSQGPDIVEPLLVLIPLMLDRGRAELDSSSSNLQFVNLTTTYRSGVSVGQLVEVQDSFQGQTWRGKIVGIQHMMQGIQAVTNLTIRRSV